MKHFIIIASVLLLFSGCKSANTQEIIDNYNAEVEKIISEYNTNAEAISKDANLSQLDIQAKLEAIEEKAINNLKNNALSVIKKYPADSSAIVALKDVAVYFDADELKTAINSLKGNNTQDPVVLSLKKALDAKLSTAEGQMFTDFTITQPDGSIFNLSDIVGKGKYILVDFWSWWCGPCKAEVPNLINVYNRFHGDQFDMLSVGVWERGTPEKCTEVAAELGICWNQTINGGSVPTDIYGIDGIPHIILFGPDGTILKRDLRGAAITKELEKYIK